MPKKITSVRDHLISLPNPHLREPSQKVGLIDNSILKLAEDMQAVLIDWEEGREHEVGVALAAIQIDKPKRLIVVREDFNDKNNHNFHIFINPVILKREGEIVEDFEGCLSINEIYGKVPRYSKVRLKALNIYGREVRLKAEGFLARTLQHEVDHTNGIVFVDHIKDKSEAFFRLTAEGSLESLNYEKDIRNSRIFW